MYTDKKNILQLVALLPAHGVRRAVLCPGSRNVPLVRSLAAHPEVECHSVTDERSAGFFAIGLALQTGAPVAVCCTSGSALLNLHPAVCEAFYRQIPLVVISADRPAAWIGQMDGQTLPQAGVFGALVKRWVDLPEVRTDEDEWYCNRLINEALLEAVHHGGGPVHINVPLSEPLFGQSTAELPQVRCIRRVTLADEGVAAHLRAEMLRADRCMAVSGQLTVREAEQVARCLPVERVAWLTEVLGNVPAGVPAVRRFDAALYACTDEDCEQLRPDLLITFGGHIVSKRLKAFLRRCKPREHWHIAPDGRPVDLFCCLTRVVEASPEAFWSALVQAGPFGESRYPQLWRHRCATLEEPQPGYSGLYVAKSILNALPAGSVLHLANSSAVRIAELFALPAGVEVHGNRGVNGIEGSLSAAVGYAAASERLNVLLIGDLSFFYDMNALSIAPLRSRLRIVLLNNGGGGIFHTLPGLAVDEEARRFVTASHAVTAEGWARSRGFVYRCAADASALQSALEVLFDPISEAPVLLEVMTTAETDAAEQERYYHNIKDKIRNL